MIPVKPSDAPTVKAKRAPLVLCVGLGAAFVRRCNEAAMRASASVVAVEAGGESTFAMQTLPSAVIMHESAVPGSPLGAIARELGIELVTITDEQLSDERIEELVHGALAAARERWRLKP
jgi:hypothetical protein